jgi:hypothetical protein
MWLGRTERRSCPQISQIQRAGCSFLSSACVCEICGPTHLLSDGKRGGWLQELDEGGEGGEAGAEGDEQGAFPSVGPGLLKGSRELKGN